MSIRLQGVSKSFGQNRAVADVNLSIQEGEFFALLGPSSAGKTTLLRTICGLETPEEGSISLFDTDITNAPILGRGLAMVFQSFALYPHLTTYENLAFPLAEIGTSKAEIDERVRDTAELLHISHRLENKVTTLSGGEQQRVAIGRAIIRRPKVLLLDEPLTNLDAKLRDEMRVEFKRLHRELGITILYATPDQLEATTLADRIALIDEGKILDVGKPTDLYFEPRNVKVAQMVGAPQTNVFDAQIADKVTKFAFGEIPIDFGQAAGRYQASIRPHDIHLVEDGPFVGSVQTLEPLGDVTLLTAVINDVEVRLATQTKQLAEISVGAELHLQFDTDSIQIFDHASGESAMAQ